MDPLNPLAQIKSSCSYVNSVATHVKIDTNKIIEFANILEKDCNYSSFNADGWHYTEDASVFGPMTAQYIFVLDSLNFCFWPCPTLEYEQLASILTKVLKSDSHAFDAIRLQALTKEDIARWFVGYDIPLLEERVDRLRELGFGLTASKHFYHYIGKSLFYECI